MAGSPNFEITHPGALEVIAASKGAISWILDLEQMFGLLPEELDWRYDDNDSIIGIASEETLQQGMQEMLDAFLNDYLAQTLASGWRAQEACEAAIYSLNNGWIVSFNSLARVSLEASILSMARFQDFIVRVQGLKNATTREKWLSEWQLFDESNNSANFGRHKDHRGNFTFASTSISRHMDKSDKYLQNIGGDKELLVHVRNVYSDLCEITHPNAEGLQVYWNLEGAEPIFPGAPSYRKLEFSNGKKLNRNHLSLVNGLWALGFSAQFATEVFYRFSQLEVQVSPKKSGYGKSISVIDVAISNKKLV